MKSNELDKFENTARQLERAEIVFNMEDCKTLEDFQEFRESLKKSLNIDD